MQYLNNDFIAFFGLFNTFWDTNKKVKFCQFPFMLDFD